MSDALTYFRVEKLPDGTWATYTSPDQVKPIKYRDVGDAFRWAKHHAKPRDADQKMNRNAFASIAE